MISQDRQIKMQLVDKSKISKEYCELLLNKQNLKDSTLE